MSSVNKVSKDSVGQKELLAFKSQKGDINPNQSFTLINVIKSDFIKEINCDADWEFSYTVSTSWLCKELNMTTEEEITDWVECYDIPEEFEDIYWRAIKENQVYDFNIVGITYPYK